MQELRRPPKREGPTEEELLVEAVLAEFMPEFTATLPETLAELAPELLRFLRVALLVVPLEGPKKSKRPISILWC
jgi:hypothetical protein